MPLDKAFVQEIIKRANTVKNPVTGERLGDVLSSIIRSCAQVTETHDEFIDCIEDALGELKEIVNEVAEEKKRKR